MNSIRRWRAALDAWLITAPDTTTRVLLIARAVALCGVALSWLWIGLGVVADAAGQNPAAWHTLMPAWFRVSSWAVPAAFAITTLLTFRLAPLTVALLSLGPMIRVTSYFAGWIEYVLDNGMDGVRNGWYLAGLHTGMFVLVLVVAVLCRVDYARRRGAA